MSDVMDAPKSEREGIISNKMLQQKLTLASGTLAGAAAATRFSPLVARGLVRAAPKARGSERMNSLATGAGRERVKDAATSIGITAGATGALSSLNWSRQLKGDVRNDLKRTEKANRKANRDRREREALKKSDLITLTKKDNRWRSHVSDDANNAYDHLTGERKKFRLQQLATAGALGGGLGTILSPRTKGLTRAAGAGLTAAGVYGASKFPENERKLNTYKYKADMIERRGNMRRKKADLEEVAKMQASTPGAPKKTLKPTGRQARKGSIVSAGSSKQHYRRGV